MKNMMSIIGGEGVSLVNVADRVLNCRLFNIIRDETMYVEKKYGDMTAVISAFSVYLFIQPVFMSLWPMWQTTFSLANEILRFLLFFTAEALNFIVCKAKSTARTPEYVHIQNEIIPVTPIVPICVARARLLYRHQDRGCSDSAPNDNLLRRSPQSFLRRCEQRSYDNKLSKGGSSYDGRLFT